MYTVIMDGVTYFIKKDVDTIHDYFGDADEVYVSKNERQAIRRHLLMQVGIMEDDEYEAI